MIRVAFTPTSVKVTGHAGVGKRGEDVVCAAVSALVQCLVYGLGEIAGVPVKVLSWEPGDLAAEWPAGTLAAAGDTLCAAVAGSLREIAARHADRVTVTGADEIVRRSRSGIE